MPISKKFREACKNHMASYNGPANPYIVHLGKDGEYWLVDARTCEYAVRTYGERCYSDRDLANRIFQLNNITEKQRDNISRGLPYRVKK